MMLQLTLSPPRTFHWTFDALLAWYFEVLWTHIVKLTQGERVIWYGRLSRSKFSSEGHDLAIRQVLCFTLLEYRLSGGVQLPVKVRWKVRVGFPGPPASPPKAKEPTDSSTVSIPVQTAKTKQTKTLRSRGFWCPAGLQSFHVKQVHALVRTSFTRWGVTNAYVYSIL